MCSHPAIKEDLCPKLTKYIPHTPTPKQSAFLWLTCEEAFFGGAAGGGKSDALLMAALQYVDTPGYSAILIRDTYKNLSMPESLMDRSFEWLAPTDAHWSGDHKCWRFPSGATLSFGYLDGPRDHFNYQSAAYQFVGIDEVVNIREQQALYMFSRIRKLEGMNIPLRFRCASNPPTREQLEKGQWVKNRYVNPKTREDGVIYIPSRMDDNPHLNQESYRKSLSKLDPVTREQLEKGDWEIRVRGRMFQREWFKIVDLVPAETVMTVRFWDNASTEDDPKKDGAYTSGVKISSTESGLYYIESVVRTRKRTRERDALIRQIADTDGPNVHIFMEQEPGSSGKDVIDYFQRKILPDRVFQGIRPSGSKAQRAELLSSHAEAGNIFCLAGHWNEDFLEEIELFPDGPYKDQTDACAGAFNQVVGIMAEPRVRWA